MTLLDRIAHAVAFDLKESTVFPADYPAFRSQVENHIPEALDWAAPGHLDLIEEWIDAGCPGAELPAGGSVIDAIRARLKDLIVARLDPLDVLHELSDYLPRVVRQRISEAGNDDPEALFNLMAPYFRAEI